METILKFDYSSIIASFIFETIIDTDGYSSIKCAHKDYKKFLLVSHKFNDFAMSISSIKMLYHITIKDHIMSERQREQFNTVKCILLARDFSVDMCSVCLFEQSNMVSFLSKKKIEFLSEFPVVCSLHRKYQYTSFMCSSHGKYIDLKTMKDPKFVLRRTSNKYIINHTINDTLKLFKDTIIIHDYALGEPSLELSDSILDGHTVSLSSLDIKQLQFIDCENLRSTCYFIVSNCKISSLTVSNTISYSPVNFHFINCNIDSITLETDTHTENFRLSYFHNFYFYNSTVLRISTTVEQYKRMSNWYFPYNTIKSIILHNNSPMLYSTSILDILANSSSIREIFIPEDIFASFKNFINYTPVGLSGQPVKIMPF